MKRWTALAMLGAVVLALVLRVGDLGARPIHNDEAVNAVKLRNLWQRGEYAYDPDEFHGPTLYYAALPFVWASRSADSGGLQASVLRGVTVVFGTGLILLSLGLTDALGRRAVLWAALLMAVSPAMVFYSRYFIHELLLVFFTLLTMTAGWRYLQRPRTGWAILAGAGLGLMFATKETFVIAVAAMVSAVIAVRFARSRNGKREIEPVQWNRGHIGFALLATGMVWLVFFSSFFTHPTGLADSVRTYLSWLRRAGGESPHIHPWNFYFERLLFFQRGQGPVWSEAFIAILAVIGAITAWRSRGMIFGQFLVYYTVLLVAAYTVIPYKTPWCMAGFLHGLILLAGIGAAALMARPRGVIARIGVGAVVAIGVAHLAWQSWRASHVFAASPVNPYNYAQTSAGVVKLARRIEAIATLHPDKERMTIKVIAPENDYGPLLWYLRGFERVGWWDHLPADPFAPVVIVDAEMKARLDDLSGRAHLMVGIFELRPGKYLELYVETELWRRYVEDLPPPELRGEDER